MAVVGICRSCAAVALRLIAIGSDFFHQPVIMVIQIPNYSSCGVGLMSCPVLQIISDTAFQALTTCAQNGPFQDIPNLVIGIFHPSVDAVLFIDDPFLRQTTIRIIFSANYKTLRRSNLSKVAVRIIAIFRNS